MNQRLAKQIVFGAIYLIIFAVIGYSFYFVFLKSAPSCFDNKKNQGEVGIDCGGSCADCELKTLSPLKAQNVKYFPAGDKAIIALEIKNQNIGYASDNFSYIFNIYDKNRDKIESLRGSSFVYTSDVKCLAEIADVDYADIADIKINFSNINWIRKEKLEKPKIEVREVSTRLSDGRNQKIEVSGVVVNQDAFALSKARIIGFLANSNGLKISASKTELENIAPSEERPFKIIFPENILLISGTSALFEFGNADPGKTIICAEGKK